MSQPGGDRADVVTACNGVRRRPVAEIVQPPFRIDPRQRTGPLPPPTDLVGTRRMLILTEDPWRLHRPFLPCSLHEGKRLLIEREAPPLPRLRRGDLQPLRVPNRMGSVDRDRLINHQSPIDYSIPTKGCQLRAASPRHGRQPQSEVRPWMHLLGGSERYGNFIDRHDASRRLLSSLRIRVRHRIGRQQLPPNGLTERSPKQRVQVPDLSVASTCLVHPQMPAVHISY